MRRRLPWTTLRRLVYDLRPPALDELGLVSALRQRRCSGWPCGTPGWTITLQATGDLPPLGAATEVAAYRIAVEAVSNAARHAAAHHCTIRLAADGCCTSRSSTTAAESLGDSRPGVAWLRSERAAEIGGECTVAPAEACGTRVLATLPLDAS